MKTDNDKNNFLTILLNLKDSRSNPFSLVNSSQVSMNFRNNPFGFYEDLFEQDIRCPICLGRVKSAIKPTSCIHIFCSYCIKKWYKTSIKCPVSRREISSLTKVDISNIGFNQMDLYIK